MAQFIYASTEQIGINPKAHREIGVTVGLAQGEGLPIKVTSMGVTLIENVQGNEVSLDLLDVEVKRQTERVIENLDQAIAHLQLHRQRLADELGRLESGGAEEILEGLEGQLLGR